MSIPRNWYKSVPSSDLLLAELRKRGAVRRVVQVFQRFRFITPLYFSDGVFYNEPQILVANMNRTGRYWILGRFSDYSTFLLDCQTGKVGQGDWCVVNGRDCNFRSFQEGPQYFGDKVLSLLESNVSLPEDVFDMSIPSTLKVLDVEDDGHAIENQQFQDWLKDHNLCEVAKQVLPALRLSVEVPAGGMGVLLRPDAIMRVNDSWDGIIEHGFMIVGGSGADANVYVLDFRGDFPIIGLMAMEEAYDLEYENHYVPISPSFARFFHDGNLLQNLPLDIWDARKYRTDLRWF